MRGYRCQRKAGWDTHGLPVEVEVCKELGIHSKEEIESYGVEPFIRKCLESVFRYTRQWEQLTERLGFWIRLDEAYVTYHQSYIESVGGAEKPLRPRPALPGPQDRLVVGPRRHGAQLRRSRPRLSAGGRSERLCAVSAGGRKGPPPTSILSSGASPSNPLFLFDPPPLSERAVGLLEQHRPARLDHNALDAALVISSRPSSPTWNTRSSSVEGEPR